MAWILLTDSISQTSFGENMHAGKVDCVFVHHARITSQACNVAKMQHVNAF